MKTFFKVECFHNYKKTHSWNYDNFGAARAIYEHLVNSDEFAYENNIMLWCMQDDEAFLVYSHAKS